MLKSLKSLVTGLPVSDSCYTVEQPLGVGAGCWRRVQSCPNLEKMKVEQYE